MWIARSWNAAAYLQLEGVNSIVIGIDHITTTRTTSVSQIVKVFTTILIRLFFFVIFVTYCFPFFLLIVLIIFTYNPIVILSQFNL